jgi:hypothetical protein
VHREIGVEPPSEPLVELLGADRRPSTGTTTTSSRISPGVTGGLPVAVSVPTWALLIGPPHGSAALESGNVAAENADVACSRRCGERERA